ncbi:Hypothetical protein D9617_3g019050 [Elsinoe fawcettii]|nr:Hypothetical protein D9617_3g019050 [Elsinoe fawcettii]
MLYAFAMSLGVDVSNELPSTLHALISHRDADEHDLDKLIYSSTTHRDADEDELNELIYGSTTEPGQFNLASLTLNTKVFDDLLRLALTSSSPRPKKVEESLRWFLLGRIEACST